ncbi:putative coiled-coil domain-containing protein-like isoform X1 [Capsicum annuum]|nr:putative coiled-coil domain-containing protein-like isoform X1 [Capsicum annuum]
MDFYYRFLYQNLFLLLATLFISVFFHLLPLFTSIPTLFLRLRRGDAALDNSEFSDAPAKENDKKISDNVMVEEELEPKFEAFEDVFERMDSDKNDDRQNTEFCFKFKFPTYEEFSKNKTETGELIVSDAVQEKCFSSLIQEPKEFGCGMKGVFDLDDEGREEVIHDKIDGIQEEEVHANWHGHQGCQKEIEGSDTVCKQFLGEADFPDEFLFQSEKDSSGTDSDTVSVGFEPMRSLMSRLVNSYSDGFLSDEDFGGEFELDPLNDIDSDLKNLEMSEENLESTDFEDSDSDINEELRKLEQEEAKNDSEFLSQNDFHEDLGMVKSSEFVKEDDKLINGPQESENLKSKNTAIADTSQDANKLESLWEHQELIEQLKMEIRKVRATGLPTILEESECPTMDELQPWKIDEMLHREDSMSELHKFYKSYREKMRKFDILTYQKMYAIGYLQKDPLKDPLQLVFNQKSTGPTLKSLLSQNIRLFKHKSHDFDPMVKFIKELQSDFEVIYVGQMCLSWEFLHWQYMKALNLWDSDPRGIRKYNEIAGEFQQFQVLMQRFIENEPFQGPRVQYFIKSRYDLRNLLQVPVIRDDRVKNRNKARTKEKTDYPITSDMLVEILEESIRIFWRFIRSDKDCYSVMAKGQKGIHPTEVQEQEELEFLLEVRKNLEKKEKKLQDVLKSGNCILRKFRKNREEEESDHVLYFFSQVDMKLVSRVLNMSRLTKDQLVWCHNKLSRISFAHRKIQVEPSFLLFPC